MKTALLLIAHGSRHDRANADLHHIVAEMRGRATYDIVEAAYLEMAEPDIDQGGQRCVEQGAGRVILLPYFLSAGVHVSRDLADARQRLAGQYVGVEFHLAEPFGRHPLLLEIVAQRAREAQDQAQRA